MTGEAMGCLWGNNEEGVVKRDFGEDRIIIVLKGFTFINQP